MGILNVRASAGSTAATGAVAGGDIEDVAAATSMCSHHSPTAALPGGHVGAPTHAPRIPDQACEGQQQWPAVSALATCPAGQDAAWGGAATHSSLTTTAPDGHIGTPAQAPRTTDHTCPGQQQCPRVSMLDSRPPSHNGAAGGGVETQPSPDTTSPAGQAGSPTHTPRDADHTCEGQQHSPAVSAVRTLPSGHGASRTTQVPPSATIPAGHSGTPTHTSRLRDHACAGQQQCPAVSADTACPAGHLVTGGATVTHSVPWVAVP